MYQVDRGKVSTVVSPVSEETAKRNTDIVQCGQGQDGDLRDLPRCGLQPCGCDLITRRCWLRDRRSLYATSSAALWVRQRGGSAAWRSSLNTQRTLTRSVARPSPGAQPAMAALARSAATELNSRVRWLHARGITRRRTRWTNKPLSLDSNGIEEPSAFVLHAIAIM